MKNHRTPNRRAFAALVPATLLFAAPAFAQDVPAATTTPPPAQVTPPPVVPTVSEPSAPAPTTVAPTVAVPVIAPADTTTDAPAPTVARTTRAVTRTSHVTHTAAPAATRAAPAPVAAAPAESAAAPVVTPAPVEAAAPPPAAPAATTETTTTTESAPIWPWILAGVLVVLGAIGLLVMRRRRAAIDEAYYGEPEAATTLDEPAPVTTPRPIMAEPGFVGAAAPEFLRTPPLAPANDVPAVQDTPAIVASEDAALAEPEAAEVAELTAGDAPEADRPWLEFALRPVRAGISADEALVEIELTVGNSGSVKAKDVRISTFLFAQEPGNESEMERMLIERGLGHEDGDHEDSVRPVTIEPGEGTRIDATLALPKAQLIETTNGSILPVVIADARYTLADGREGRTSASFTIGVSEEGTPPMSPLSLAERGMHDEVEARLYGVPEHA